MKKKEKSLLRDFIESIIFAVVLAAFIIVFVVQGFYIPSGSMRTTLLENDRILVNKFIYRFAEPQRGDIIVFKWPVDESKIFVKRLIALPGEEVEIRSGTVLINGKKIDEPYLNVIPEGNYGPVTVPPNEFFVLGDNRNMSDDSRFWGFVPRKNIKGKAFLIYYPLTRISLLKDPSY
jgi:signal peptidase I